MINTIKRTIKGCGYLPTCGHHPGTFTLFSLILIGALTGTTPKTAFQGSLMMACLVTPLYLMGAHDRALDEEQFTQQQHQ